MKLAADLPLPSCVQLRQATRNCWQAAVHMEKSAHFTVISQQRLAY